MSSKLFGHATTYLLRLYCRPSRSVKKRSFALGLDSGPLRAVAFTWQIELLLS